jgi:hypothetical protein
MGLTSINGDIWFRSVDGWRLYRQARALSVGWPQVPLSSEIRPYIDSDTISLLKFGSCIQFDRRLIGTSSPVPHQGRFFHRGLVSLDFDIVSSFGTASTPAWDGHWTGPRITFLATGNFNDTPRAFAFGLDDDDHNVLYEISKNDPDDFDGPIHSHITTRALSEQSSVSEKKIYGGDVWVNDVTEDVDLTVTYKPDDYPDWLAWHTFPTFTPLSGGNSGLVQNTERPAFQPRKTLPKVDEIEDPNTQRVTRRFYQLLVNFDWIGHMSILRFRLWGHDPAEDSKAFNL